MQLLEIVKEHKLEGQMRWLVAQKNQVRNGEIYRYIAGEPCRCHCCYLYWLDVVRYAQKQSYMGLLGLGRYCLGGPCACAGTTFTQQQVCIATFCRGGCNERSPDCIHDACAWASLSQLLQG